MSQSNTKQHISDGVFDIPHEVVKGTQFKGFLMFDLVFFVLIASFALKVDSVVHHSVKLIAVIFIIAVGVFWILPSPVSKGKRNFEVLILSFAMNHKPFRPTSVTPYNDTGGDLNDVN